jgi:hypothetical protein
MKKSSLSALISIFLIAFIGHNSFANTNQGLTDLGIPAGFPLDIVFGSKSSMITDADGTVWIGLTGNPSWPDTLRGYLARWHEGDWSIFTTSNSGLPDNWILSLYAHHNTLFVGTLGGLGIYDGEWGVINTENGLVSNMVHSVFVHNDILYVGTDEGLSVFEGADWMHYNTSNSDITGDVVQALTMDSENMLWVGTSTGLSSFDGSTWVSYPQASELDIQVLAFDQSANLWIGSNGNGGLHKFKDGQLFDHQHFNVFSLNQSLNVRSITVLANGDVVVPVQTYDVNTLLRITPYNSYLYDFRFQKALITAFSDELYITGQNPRNLFKANFELAQMWNSYSQIEVNNIRTAITANGQLSCCEIPVSEPMYEFPSGSGTHTVFMQSLLLAGKSGEAGNETLHAVLPMYGYMEAWWRGPAGNEGTYQLNQEAWNRVWYLSKDEIDFHIANWSQPDYEMPLSIVLWPAHGDVSLGQSQQIAPFFDANQNGLYEPELGEYPLIRGDYALYFIFNDQRKSWASQSHFNTEVRGMLYGYHAPDNPALNNTLFLNYQLYNMSDIDYHGVYVGMNSNFDIGSPWDDYVGCDTSLHAYFIYNGREIDEWDGPDTYPVYGEHPPAQAATFLNRPLSTFFNKWAHPLPPSDYSTNEQAYFNMQAIWQDGTPMTYGGTGYPTEQGDTVRAMHLFPGDLNNPDAWHEIALNNPFGDRRGLGSSYIGDFLAGDMICFDVALVTARDMDGDHISSVDLVKEHIAEVRNFFNENFGYGCQDLMTTNLQEQEALPTARLQVYPNPTGHNITIRHVALNQVATYRLFNAMGSMVESGKLTGLTTTVSMHHLPAGLYIIQVADDKILMHQKLIKH